MLSERAIPRHTVGKGRAGDHEGHPPATTSGCKGLEFDASSRILHRTPSRDDELSRGLCGLVCRGVGKLGSIGTNAPPASSTASCAMIILSLSRVAQGERVVLRVECKFV